MYRRLQSLSLWIIAVVLVVEAKPRKIDKRYLSAGQGIPESKKPVIGKCNFLLI